MQAQDLRSGILCWRHNTVRKRGKVTICEQSVRSSIRSIIMLNLETDKEGRKESRRCRAK